MEQANQKNFFFDFVNVISIIFLLLTIGQFIYIQFNNPDLIWSFTYRRYYILTADFIFFNTLHVPMTFFLLVTIPGFKIWLNNYHSSFKKMKIEILIAFILFFLASYFGGQTGNMSNRDRHSMNVYTGIIYNTLFWLLTAYHGVGQSYGLSMIISKENQSKNMWSEKIEKKLFQALPIFWFFRLIELLFAVQDKSIVDTYHVFFNLNYALCIFICIAIFINAFFFHQSIKKKKIIFLSRILLIPFIGIVPMAGFSTSANHGVEYLYVVRNVFSKQANRKTLTWGLIVVLCIWSFLAIPRYFAVSQIIDISILTPFMAFLTSVDLVHYWLDRNIFRIRNEISLKNIAPLIK